MSKLLLILLLGVLVGAFMVRAEDTAAGAGAGAGADAGGDDADFGADEADDAEMPEDFQGHEEVPPPEATTLEYKLLWGTQEEALAAIDQLSATKIIPKISVTAQMKKLIKEDVVDPTSLVNCTYLHLAAVSDFDQVVQKALAAGLDKDATCQLDGHMEIQELTAVKAAAYFGSAKAIKLLTAAGAKLVADSDKEQDYYPVLLASDRGHTEVIQILLDAGAPVQPSPNSPTREAALHYAVINGHEAIVDMLLAKGADVNFATAQGDTALHAACWIGNATMVKKLLEKGANTRLATADSLLAIDLAREQEHKEIVALIEEADKAKGLEPSPVRKLEDIFGSKGGEDGGSSEFEDLMRDAKDGAGDMEEVDDDDGAKILDGSDDSAHPEL